MSFAEQSVPLKASLQQIIDNGTCDATKGGNGQRNQDIEGAAAGLVNVLNQIQEFALSDDVTNLKNIFDEFVKQTIKSAQASPEFIYNSMSIAYYAFAGPAFAFGIVFIFGITLASLDKDIKPYFCVQKWIFLTALFIFITFSAVFVSMLGVITVGASGKFLFSLMIRQKITLDYLSHG